MRKEIVFWVFLLTSFAYSIVGDFDKAAVFVVGAGVIAAMNSERKQ